METFDFAQWKWMQLRSMESAQAIEKENIELRKKLLEIQSFSSNENSQTKEALRGFSGFLKSWLQKQREETKALKFTYEENFVILQQQNTAARDTMKKLAQIMLNKDKQFVLVKGERDAIKLELNSAREQLLSSSQGQLQELEKLRSKVTKLQSEVKVSDKAKNDAMEELASIKQKYDALMADSDRNNVAHSERDKKIEELKLENRGLRDRLSRTESEAMRLLTEAREAQRRNAFSYEEIIAGLRNENRALREAVEALQLQIEKLTAALMGNKSHFAKFVELKSENVTLQNKLSLLLQKQAGPDLVSGIRTSALSLSLSGGAVQPQAASSSSAAAATAAGIAGVITLDGIAASNSNNRGGAAGGLLAAAAAAASARRGSLSQPPLPQSQTQSQSQFSLSGSFLKAATSAATSVVSTDTVGGGVAGRRGELLERQQSSGIIAPGSGSTMRKVSFSDTGSDANVTIQPLEESAAAAAAMAAVEEGGVSISRLLEQALGGGASGREQQHQRGNDAAASVPRGGGKVLVSTAAAMTSSSSSFVGVPQASFPAGAAATSSGGRHKSTSTSIGTNVSSSNSSKMPGSGSKNNKSNVHQRSASLEKFAPVHQASVNNLSLLSVSSGLLPPPAAAVSSSSAATIRRSESFENRSLFDPANNPNYSSSNYPPSSLSIGVPLMGRETRNSLKDRVVI